MYDCKIVLQIVLFCIGNSRAMTVHDHKTMSVLLLIFKAIIRQLKYKPHVLSFDDSNNVGSCAHVTSDRSIIYFCFDFINNH